MRKFLKTGIAICMAAVMVSGCGNNSGSVVNDTQNGTLINQGNAATESENMKIRDYAAKSFEDAVNIVLSDEGILVDGSSISTDSKSAVYAANDIVYYEEGKDFTYGEGEEKDEHSAEEAAKYTVVHITKPGTYAVTGSISAGQIAIDLGEDAKENPEAVVNLIMNNADITCSVAPAVIFYNVYECGSDDEAAATKDVDTSNAGANVIIADGTLNNVTGSYVARIYKSVELNAEKTEVVDSKKLHKYDGAFYSKMSMNVNGDENGTGILNIYAENEGLDTELHLTINGGNINIISGNDGINTNEDGISVTTINGGSLTIVVSGETGEGDGIDSNGWLVINGGIVRADACSTSGDAGIDSDMGIHINGGDVVATGNMLDHISESTQNYAVFCFDGRQKGENTFTLKDENLNVVAEAMTVNDFSYLIVSNENLNAGTYTLWSGENQYQGCASTGEMGGMGNPSAGNRGTMPENMPGRGERPNNGAGNAPENGFGKDAGFNRQELETNADGTITLPDGTTINPDDMQFGGKGQGANGQFGGNHGEMMPGAGNLGEVSVEFVINDGGNYFGQVVMAE